MLLEVSIENFKSFSEKQTFTMYAVEKGNIKNSTLSCKYVGQEGKLKTQRLYKTSVIYGLNNSGKSNFIKAINYINSVVKNSWQGGLPNKQEHQYFRLNSKYKNKPSVFEIVFIAKDKIKYEYSFSLDNIQIYNEKLIAYPKGQKKLYFERQFNNETKKYDYDTKNLVGNSPIQIQGIIGDTRSDCLFLSTAIKYGNEFLKPVIEFLTQKLHISPNFLLNENLTNTFDIKKTKSSGTNALLNLLTLLFLIQKEDGGILFFDGLDCSLHPKVLILLMKLIYKMDWNIQLIFSAHNTVLLKNKFDVFRKYQVWFVDKEYDGSSILYSAGETSVRKEKDLEDLYFNGRFSENIFI